MISVVEDTALWQCSQTLGEPKEMFRPSFVYAESVPSNSDDSSGS